MLEPEFPVLFRIRCRNRLPEPLLRAGVPVAAIEFEENRGIGNGHFRLDDEDAEELSGSVEFGNDFFVGDVGDVSVVERSGEFSTVVLNARSVDFRDKVEFLVYIDVGADVDAGSDGVENMPNHRKLIGPGDEGFDAVSRLRRISCIRNDDPVTVAIKREDRADLGFPIAGCDRGHRSLLRLHG